jgi:hypothetical protein
MGRRGGRDFEGPGGEDRRGEGRREEGAGTSQRDSVAEELAVAAARENAGTTSWTNERSSGSASRTAWTG